MIEYVDAKTIITKVNHTGWFDYDYNMNIYRGCHHGCIYCDSRSDVYQVADFDKVKPKKDAIKIIEKELKNKRNKGVIGTGAMSDPYNKLEEELQLTRQALEIIDKHGFGVGITTKSTLILRDIDILKRIALHSPVIIKITITCANDELTKLIEPNVASSKERFLAIKKLREAGIYAGVILMPVLPYLTDSWNNINSLLMLSKAVDASFIYAAFGVSQRTGQRAYYLNKLKDISQYAYENHLKSFGNNYSCPAHNAKELYRKYELFCKENKLTYKMKDIINGYQKGYRCEQISLF
ncbi:DNA repair photolyase [Bacilli bacterium PM5-3]|nr:DNA repair photolyase [Bacilli bacterium PM5-3]MDH6603715.1 DNA repair photolyase [Bacilli bacterium PM5-9]